MSSNQQIIDDIIAREGGDTFTMDPADPGGATKFGITQRTLSDYLGRGVSVQEVRELTREVAEDIYEKLYIEKPGYNKIIYHSLKELLVDCAVNHGPSQATKWLQTALGVTADGIIGSQTRNAITLENYKLIYTKICSYRIKFYVRLVIKNPKLIKFLQGWIFRGTSFLERVA